MCVCVRERERMTRDAVACWIYSSGKFQPIEQDVKICSSVEEQKTAGHDCTKGREVEEGCLHRFREGKKRCPRLQSVLDRIPSSSSYLIVAL